MSRYYDLSIESNPKITGVNDLAQVEISRSGFEEQQLYDRIFEFFNCDDYWHKADREPDFEIELQCVRALRHAKMTSFLSYRPHLLGCSFLVSDEVKKCLEKFNLQKHHLFKAKVFYKNQVLKYWIFHTQPLGYDVIDFKESLFFTGALTRKQYHSINDLSEYRELSKTAYLKPEKISLNENFDKSLDLFEIKGGMFVSEELKNEFEKNCFSGVKLIAAFGDEIQQIKVETKN